MTSEQTHVTDPTSTPDDAPRCRVCGEPLAVGNNWWPSAAQANRRICKHCHLAYQRRRRLTLRPGAISLRIEKLAREAAEMALTDPEVTVGLERLLGVAQSTIATLAIGGRRYEAVFRDITGDDE